MIHRDDRISENHKEDKCMSGKVQRFTQEFKDSAIQLVLNSEKSAMIIAKELGMSEKTLYAWLRQYRKKHHLESPVLVRSSINNHAKESAEEENKRLRKENARLKMERDILKKAAAFFANEAH